MIISESNKFDIVIIGGGASGIITAIQLLNHLESETTIALLEKSASIAQGSAYNTPCSCHILNGPACGMSAIGSDPLDFVKWLAVNKYPTIDQSNIKDKFVKRWFFHEYLLEKLYHAININQKIKLEIITSCHISDIDKTQSSYNLMADNKKTYQAKFVILALGNFLKQRPLGNIEEVYSHPCYIPCAWDYSALDSLKNTDHVVAVGAGPTMIDVALYLQEKGINATMTSLSRHALLPTHFPESIKVDKYTQDWDLESISLNQLFRLVRQRAKQEINIGHSWMPVFDSLREHIYTIWNKLSQKDKSRFYRHLLRYWVIHRHRLPNETWQQLSKLKTSKLLNIEASRQIAFDCQKNNITVNYLKRGSDQYTTIKAAKIVNCTGFSEDVTAIENPLIQNILTKGLGKVVDDGIKSFKTNENCQMIDNNNHLGIFVIGTLRKCNPLEQFIVPKLLDEATHLVSHLKKLSDNAES